MKQDSTREKIVSTLMYGYLFNVDIKILIFQTSWYKNKIRRWFNVDKVTLFRLSNTDIFLTLI